MLSSLQKGENDIMVDYSFEEKHQSLYDIPIDNEYAIKLKKTEDMTENEKISIMFKTLFFNSERLYFGAEFLPYFINYSYEDI